MALGPHNKWSGDGHDKLIKIGYAIWGIHDKWPGKWLELWVVPNNCLKVVIAYLYLSLIEELGGKYPLNFSLHPYWLCMQECQSKQQQTVAVIQHVCMGWQMPYSEFSHSLALMPTCNADYWSIVRFFHLICLLMRFPPTILWRAFTIPQLSGVGYNYASNGVTMSLSSGVPAQGFTIPMTISNSELLSTWHSVSTTRPTNLKMNWFNGCGRLSSRKNPMTSSQNLMPMLCEKTTQSYSLPECHECCSGFPSPTRLQGWSPKCGTLADRLVVLRGVLDVGFSSYAAPTYNLVSEYFGVQELRLGVSAERCSTRVQVLGDA